jgi:hypothetical protein
VHGLAFSPDGTQLVSGGGDNIVRVHAVDWRRWLQIGCERLQHHPLLTNQSRTSTRRACMALASMEDHTR